MTNMKTKTTTSKSTKTTSTSRTSRQPRKGQGASPTKVRPSQAYMFHQAIAAIDAAREQLPLATVTTTRDRVELLDLRRAARVPDAFLEAMASLVSRNGGSLMGLSFDADAARELLAYGTAAKPFIDMARDVAHQVDEDIVRKRAALADHAISILRALEALAETPEGKGFARDAQLLRSTLGTKKRKQRSPKQAAAAPGAPATVTAPAVVITPVKPALSSSTACSRAPTISHRPDRPRRWYPGGGVLCPRTAERAGEQRSGSVQPLAVAAWHHIPWDAIQMFFPGQLGPGDSIQDTHGGCSVPRARARGLRMRRMAGRRHPARSSRPRPPPRRRLAVRTTPSTTSMRPDAPPPIDGGGGGGIVTHDA